ncbi:MAG: 4-hydroxy-tetrahydrodipicolinate reductase [Firmicutes bacterium]|nr:4-hydroxy-tetrahydrodipicolinate reductase [Bacillota bacterium]
MSDKIKLILCGCSGRMGTAISNMVANTDNMEIVLGVDALQPAEPRPYPVYANINREPTPVNVIISYLPPTESGQEDTLALLEFGAANNTPLVICTTGLSKNVEKAISKASKNTAVFYSGNMSLGINVLANVLTKVSKLLYDSNFDIELIEKHHNKKLDAPSGTAVMLLDAIMKAVYTQLNTITDRTGSLSQRSRNEIGVSAVRGGNIIGEHSIIFAGQNELIEITHSAQSRDVFAEGTLKAAEFIHSKPPGLYNMQDLINSSIFN